MRYFILGIISVVITVVVAAVAVIQLGLFPTRADAAPSNAERQIAMRARDASMDRHAPRVSNPLPVTDQNLIDGMKIYTTNCAECHGALDLHPSSLEHSMYPPPPQLILNPVTDPEWHTYYAVRTGVRYTAMPSWNGSLSESDIWKVAAFLSRVRKVPPAVQDYWEKTYGVSLASDRGEGRGNVEANSRQD